MSTKSDPCTKANELFKKNDFQGAYKFIVRCRKSLEADLRKAGRKDPNILTRQISTGMLEGNILLKLRKYKKAEEIFVKLLRLLQNKEYFREGKEIENAKGRVLLLLAISVQEESLEKRINYLENSYQCFIKGKYFEEASEVGISLITSYRKVREMDKALDHAKNLLKISKKIKNKTVKKSFEAQCHFEIGRLEEDQKKAMKRFDKAEKLFSELQSMEGVGQVRLTRVISQAKWESPQKTKEDLNKLREFASTNKLYRLETEIKYHLGILEAQEGNINAAVDNLHDALQDQTKSNDPAVSGMAFLELARLSFTEAKTEEEYKNCIKLIKRSVEKFERIDETEGMAMAHELRGNILVILERTKEAVKYLERALKLYRKLNHLDSIGRTYTILADAHSVSRIQPLIIQALKKGEKAYLQAGNVLGLADIYQRYALYYINHEHSADKAREYIRKTREVMSKNFPSESVKNLIEGHLKKMEKAIS